MRLSRKTFEVVLGICVDGKQIEEASDQDVLDAYAQIPKGVRELDATMRAAKAEGDIVADEIFREDVVATMNPNGDFNAFRSFGVDHAKGVDRTVFHNAWTGSDVDVDAVKRAVEKLGEGGGHKVEGPVLVPPGLPVLTVCAPGHEKAIEAFQNNLENILVAERDSLRNRVAQLEARESTWKSKLEYLERRQAVLDAIKNVCCMIHLNDDDFVVAHVRLRHDARRADRCEEEVSRKGKHIQKLEMRVGALQKELAETHDGETRAKLAERRAMWRARCEEAERQLSVFSASVVALVGRDHPDPVHLLRKMKGERDDLRARLATAEALISTVVADLAAARARIEELEAERDLARGVSRRAAQTIIDCIGSVGPEDADSAAGRIVSRVAELEGERDLEYDAHEARKGGV